MILLCLTIYQNYHFFLPLPLPIPFVNTYWQQLIRQLPQEGAIYKETDWPHRLHIASSHRYSFIHIHSLSMLRSVILQSKRQCWFFFFEYQMTYCQWFGWCFFTRINSFFVNSKGVVCVCVWPAVFKGWSKCHQLPLSSRPSVCVCPSVCVTHLAGPFHLFANKRQLHKPSGHRLDEEERAEIPWAFKW